MAALIFWLCMFCVCCFTTAKEIRLRRSLSTSQESSCGSWVTYSNEKCLHIVDSAVFQTKYEAGVVCESLAEVMGLDDIPRLVTVNSEKEQKILQQFLFDEVGLLEPIWLGLNREDDGVFRWNNGAEMHFNNLAKQLVSDADKPCVQMESGEGTYSAGQWVRVNCRKRNVVVCEKLQVWSVAKLQSNFLNFKLQMDRKVGRQQNLVERPMATLGKIAVMAFKSSPCAGWAAYKDESCILLAFGSGTPTKEGADLVCQSMTNGKEDGHVPKLVTIKTEDKQKFISKLLSENRTSHHNVWLGLKLDEESVYRWNDGSELSFANWERYAPPDHQHQCVHMESGEDGHWVRTKCSAKNAVVCERAQSWTMTKLENTLNNLKLEVEQKHKESEKRIMAVKQEASENITNIINNPVPVGFIYVQIPGQLSPLVLWPQVTWKDASQDYAGLFFRVQGGGSAPFGNEQDDNTRRLIGVNNGFSGGEGKTDPLPAEDTWSNYVLTGGAEGKAIALRFRFSPGEVRPRNKAVKIWQRIK